ncbi:DMT family transporter [Geopsychrobacter electrodiphilus]|uniref:DMT family transporter n=1 Tax=Geopsychrobacter electrodiphilus TaxID=225196 RepID=UPI00036B6CFF|nr:DMT family transporter [Geopsychrobacter electrodiphilus]
MNHSPSVAPPHLLLRLLAGSVCISFSPVFIKLADVPPDPAGFYRMLFASLSLLVLLRLQGGKLTSVRNTLLLLAGGGLFLSIDFMCWHRSIHLVGPGLATLLANFQVFFTALFACLFLKQKITRLFMLAVVIALIGLLLITGVDWNVLGEGTRLGILLGLATAVFYSGYILLLKGALNSSSVSGVAAMLVVSLISTVLLGLVTSVGGASFVIPDVSSLLALLGVGVVSTTLGWTLISSAIKFLPATTAGLVLLLQPALACVWDVIFFARPTNGTEVVGITLILGAIYIGSYRKNVESLAKPALAPDVTQSKS